MGTPGTSTLRTTSFLILALGALLLGVGTVLTWVSVGIAGSGSAAIETYPGIDLWQGRVALGCAVVLLIGTLVLRAGSSDRGRRAVAVVMVVAGFVAVGVTGAALLGAASSFEDRAVEDMAAAAGVDEAQVQRIADDLGFDSSNGAGVYLSMAGAIAATAAAVLGLAWATRPSQPDDPSATAATGDLEREEPGSG